MKVLFHTNTLNYRGTTVAVADYARYNQEILGNESVIVYCKTFGEEKDMGNVPEVIESLEKNFKVIGYRAGDLEKKIDKEVIDVAYFINSGRKEELPKNVKTAVHAVFQFNEPHGDRYAYVSKWLSDKMSNGTIPYVPHIVSLPEPTCNYREMLGIREDQVVVGRLGGYLTFDLAFVKDYIRTLVSKNDRFIFLFAGTAPFIDHPNVKFINEFSSLQKKSNFINTCDVMLHARHRGESFGLSIAEFLSQNKPVIAWSGGSDLNHLEMLKESGTVYNDEKELDTILNNILDIKQNWSERVQMFKPEPVMKKFNEVFLC